MIFSKRLTILEVAALQLALCVALSGRAAAQVLPPPGTYALDPPHTFAYFDARHLIVGLVRGRFDKTTGTITVAQDPAACSLNVTIGITKVVPLRFTFNGTAPAQAGKPARVAFHGSAGTKRADFGMTRDNLIELGPSQAPGPDVQIEIDTEALANPPTQGTVNPVAKPNHTAIVAARVTRR
ncbi:MAG: putative signal peptide protein [Massilia sp.]|nr:putative signal peptide protein [Massilia sp.]